MAQHIGGKGSRNMGKDPQDIFLEEETPDGVTLGGHLISRDDPAFMEILRHIARLHIWSSGRGEPDAVTVEMGIRLGRASLERIRLELPDAHPQAHYDEIVEMIERRRVKMEQGGYGSVVYYARRGALVKIGTTTGLRARMSSLRPEEVLAIEPGSIIHEQTRHDQFRDLRVPGQAEWFYLKPPIRELIDRIVKRYGPPPEGLATLPSDKIPDQST